MMTFRFLLSTDIHVHNAIAAANSNTTNARKGTETAHHRHHHENQSHRPGRRLYFPRGRRIRRRFYRRSEQQPVLFSSNVTNVAIAIVVVIGRLHEQQ